MRDFAWLTVNPMFLVLYSFASSMSFHPSSTENLVEEERTGRCMVEVTMVGNLKEVPTKLQLWRCLLALSHRW